MLSSENTDNILHSFRHPKLSAAEKYRPVKFRFSLPVPSDGIFIYFLFSVLLIFSGLRMQLSLCPIPADSIPDGKPCHQSSKTGKSSRN